MNRKFLPFLFYGGGGGGVLFLLSTCPGDLVLLFGFVEVESHHIALVSWNSKILLFLPQLLACLLVNCTPTSSAYDWSILILFYLFIFSFPFFLKLFLDSLWVSHHALQSHSSPPPLNTCPPSRKLSLNKEKKKSHCGRYSVSQCVPQYTLLCILLCLQMFIAMTCRSGKRPLWLLLFYLYFNLTGTLLRYLLVALHQQPSNGVDVGVCHFKALALSLRGIWARQSVGSSTVMPSGAGSPATPKPALLCCPGEVTGPTLPSATTSEGQGQLSHSWPRASFPICQRWWRLREGRRASLPQYPPSRQEHCPVLMTSGLTQLQPPHSGAGLLCCPGEVQGLLFWLLQQIRHRAISSTLCSWGQLSCLL
jgi:hypothetical protein